MLAALLTVIALQEQSATLAIKFDLVCEGKVFSTARLNGQLLFGPKGTLSTRKYRVDMGERLWCEDSCKDAPTRLARSDAYKIVFVDGHTDTSSGYTAVDRQTGDLYDEYVSEAGRLTFTGKCKPAPFSGFPAPKPLF